MTMEWLHMRIQEEQERRTREASTLDRLPLAMQELHEVLKDCVAAYTSSFGENSAEVVLLLGRIKVVACEEQNGRWLPASKVEVVPLPELPGIRIERGEYSLAIEIGLLPNEKLYYRDCEQDKFLTVEDLTRRILDRALFPRLKE